jgi:hypothetical protein
VLNQAEGQIVYRFHARDLNLVMASRPWHTIRQATSAAAWCGRPPPVEHLPTASHPAYAQRLPAVDLVMPERGCTWKKPFRT